MRASTQPSFPPQPCLPPQAGSYPNLCGMASLDLDFHLLIVDLTVCKVPLVILHGVVSPDDPASLPTRMLTNKHSESQPRGPRHARLTRLLVVSFKRITFVMERVRSRAETSHPPGGGVM